MSCAWQDNNSHFLLLKVSISWHDWGWKKSQRIFPDGFSSFYSYFPSQPCAPSCSCLGSFDTSNGTECQKHQKMYGRQFFTCVSKIYTPKLRIWTVNISIHSTIWKGTKTELIKLYFEYMHLYIQAVTKVALQLFY